MTTRRPMSRSSPKQAARARPGQVRGVKVDARKTSRIAEGGAPGRYIPAFDREHGQRLVVDC
jgi:SLT domain-containing protein